MRRLLIALAAVLAVVVVGVAVAVFFVFRNLDSLVEAAIEKYGSELTGTPVSVERVEIELSEGRATVRGLRVGNPKGFQAPDAFSWDEVTVDIDPESLTSPPYVLDAVVVAGPEVVFELNERGESNLRVLQKRLQSRGSASAGEGAGEPGGAGEAGKGEEPRLRIASLRFEGGALEARTSAVGGKDERIKLPPLRLQNVGGAKGATPGEIGRTLLTAYTEQTLRTVGKQELGRQADKLIDEGLKGEDAEAAKKLLNRVLER